MQYYTLVASLPTLPSHFDVERTPVSQPRLRQLLKQLSDEDADTVHQLSSFFRWDRQLIGWSDQDIKARYDELMRNKQPVIREIINLRINVRTIVAALRRRRANLDPPTAVGALVDTIRRNWHDPTFGLGLRHRWIEPFSQQMIEGEVVAAERILFEFSYRTWSTLAAQYHFTFEAIPLYVARWEIINRWTSRDIRIGRQRFEHLTQQALGAYANVEF